MTAATYRLTPSPSLPATPPTADYCCTSPYAGIGKLPLKTFAQQRTTTTSKFTGFLTLHRSLHSDGNRTHGGRKGCKEVTTGGGCQICQCVCVCTWCHDFVWKTEQLTAVCLCVCVWEMMVFSVGVQCGSKDSSTEPWILSGPLCLVSLIWSRLKHVPDQTTLSNLNLLFKSLSLSLLIGTWSH